MPTIKTWQERAGTFPETYLGAATAAKFSDEIRAEIDELRAEVARLKTVPMRYRRMAFNADLQTENEMMRAELARLRGTK